ncbi:recombinase family protein [Bradyrhizobium liaoningense]|uniref:recombinase family protein n=1 Tax=Bradyrhizobium liaoningense TaxID=43992 RepID=UPI001BA80600|nr:recombinase family protein [Bradyrhizobium liaoningense]MBR0719325.1 recombinase family protein [Bradyrhizobium liaoningense]
MRALVDEQYIRDLAVRTRRGLEGVIRDGQHAGGRTYGYRAVPGKPGDSEIVEQEAEIVRVIFACYVQGETLRAIAHDLNRRRLAHRAASSRTPRRSMATCRAVAA